MKTFLFKTPMVILLFISFLTYGQKQLDTDKILDNNLVHSVTYDEVYQGQSETNTNSSDFTGAIFMPFVNEISQSKSEVSKIQLSKNYYGYRFEDYPAPYIKGSKKTPFNSKKSKVKIDDIKTVISGYKKNSVNFGGHYQLCEIITLESIEDDNQDGAWHAISAMIIDTKTGIAYPTPFPGLGDEYCETGHSEKYFENTQFLYKKNSNLLITHDCDVDSGLNYDILIKIYKWDGTKFQLLETKKGRKNNKN